ncbi:hypothetical protein B0H17DRAFT_1071037 [Mycena rosella]|uniref:Uncharacterized protein n=1 Tax=Mycena rosella TaxID=1033263 RepID=A0AAD7DAR7_MYCRO|nr:hypothetical protein B0H17DRAFT_1071037 [Mycena rosella]
MSPHSLTLVVGALLAVSAVNAFCADNGGTVSVHITSPLTVFSLVLQKLGWGTPADADSNDDHPRTVLGFSTSGPFDAAGNALLSVIALNAGFDPGFFAFSAFICGQTNSDTFLQTTFGPVISATTDSPFCLTASALGEQNITIALLPCVNNISVDPVPTQMFQWVSTVFDTYALEFLGNQSGLPLDPSTPTDYVPSLVPATVGIGAHVRLDYSPGGLPPSTGHETEMVLDLVDC